MLPACNLQAVLPQRLQLPTILCETVRLLHFGTRVNLCSQVLPGSRDVRGSGSGLCSGPRDVCGSSLCSGSRDVRGSGVCSGSRDVRGSGSGVCSGSRDVRGSVCSGSGHVCGSLCSQVRSGSGHVRCSLCSGSGEVLRHRLRDQVLQCRSLRSCTLDL
jgi:hypothetical protein